MKTNTCFFTFLAFLAVFSQAQGAAVVAPTGDWMAGQRWAFEAPCLRFQFAPAAGALEAVGAALPEAVRDAPRSFSQDWIQTASRGALTYTAPRLGLCGTELTPLASGWDGGGSPLRAQVSTLVGDALPRVLSVRMTTQFADFFSGEEPQSSSDPQDAAAVFAELTRISGSREHTFEPIHRVLPGPATVLAFLLLSFGLGGVESGRTWWNSWWNTWQDDSAVTQTATSQDLASFERPARLADEAAAADSAGPGDDGRCWSVSRPLAPDCERRLQPHPPDPPPGVTRRQTLDRQT